MAKSSMVMSVHGAVSEQTTLIGPRADPLASVPFQFCSDYDKYHDNDQKHNIAVDLPRK